MAGPRWSSNRRLRTRWANAFLKQGPVDDDLHLGLTGTHRGAVVADRHRAGPAYWLISRTSRARRRPVVVIVNCMPALIRLDLRVSTAVLTPAEAQ